MPAQPLRVLLLTAPPIAHHEPYFDCPDWPRDALTHLAGYLRQFPGFAVEILDGKLHKLTFAEAAEQAARRRPDVVALTAFTTEIKPAAYLACLLKERLPDVVSVIGGAHATAMPAATLREFPSFDVAVAGEGELTFHELCAAIRDGGDWAAVPGLAFRRDGRVVRTAPRPRLAEQDLLPMPAWDLVPPAPEFWVQTERGCPFRCPFCMNHNGYVPRTRSIERVVAEIEYLVAERGARCIHFSDEMFTIVPQRTHALCDALIARNLHTRIRWDCQTHVRFVDYELFVKMKAAGCERVDLGIEAADDQTLGRMGKGTRLAHITAATDAARRAGLPFGCLLVLGHPDETLNTLRASVDLVVRLNPKIPYISLMMPYPGTGVSKLAAAGDGGYRLLTCDWDQFSIKIGRVLEFAGLSMRQILWLQLSAYLRVFLANRRFAELAGFLAVHWRPALAGLWAMLFSGSAGRRFPLRPADYDERLAAGQPFDRADLIESRDEWLDWQNSELVRLRGTSQLPAFVEQATRGLERGTELVH